MTGRRAALRIEPGSTHLGLCRSCKAEIVWVIEADTGRRIMLNPPIVFLPALEFSEEPTYIVDRTQTRSHFATCPDALAWVKRT